MKSVTLFDCAVIAGGWAIILTGQYWIDRHFGSGSAR